MTDPGPLLSPLVAAEERFVRVATELAAIAYRLSDEYLDETFEPIHFVAALKELADSELPP